MEDKPEKQQLAEIQAQVQRAKRAQVRTSGVVAQQQAALERLIELAHSPYSSLKSYAASNIKLFIKEFPDLEDAAINAVYDLCEDQDQKVRKDGYRAITQVSREQRKLVKRNADVLVQLLQSDEPEEVEVVEQQLAEHLDMDTAITLGVLCDQIVPPDEPLDEEDQATRDNLRSLVLGFMIGRAKRRIVERHASVYNSEGEKELVKGLHRAIPKIPTPDIEIIVKEILLALPSHGQHSERGEQLLDIILKEERASYKVEAPQATQEKQRSSLPRTRFYLELAYHIAVVKRAARPARLLRHYCTHLVSKVVLAGFNEDFQVFVINNFAGALAAVQEETADENVKLRNQAVDSTSSLLFCASELKSEPIPWQSCRTILQAYKQRVDASQARVPQAALRKLEERASKAQESDDARVVQSLIRSLPQTNATTPPPASSRSSPASASVAKGASSNGKTNGGRVQIKRKLEEDRPASLPPRPPSQASKAPMSRRDPPTPSRERPPHQQRLQERTRTMTAPAASSSSHTTPEPPLKRQRGSTGDGPSLLSRLGVVNDSKPAPAAQPAKRRAESEGSNRNGHRASQAAADPDAPPPGGWSIKGAASVQQKPPPPQESSNSLLDRLNRSDRDGGGGARSGGGRRKRTRT